MYVQEHNIEQQNHVNIAWFHSFTFTGKGLRKGWRTPLSKVKYSEQRDEEKERSRGHFASERGDEPRSGIPYCSVYSYTYFGARYMDHELMTMWPSVDPMADKYPSISPYAYCAWNPIICIDPDGEKIYMLFYTVGNSRGDNMFHAAALTRRSDIMKSKSFDAKNDIVVMRPIQDLASIKDEVQNINNDYGEKYGKTAEFDVWSHGGLDGPTGTQPTSSNALDSKQMKLEGWSEIDFNWDENASANFYGCRTGKTENGKPSFAQAVSELNNFKDVKVSGQSKRAYPSTSKTRRNEPSHYFGKLGLSYTKTYMVGCESSSERLWISPGRDVYPMNTFINGEQQ